MTIFARIAIAAFHIGALSYVTIPQTKCKVRTIRQARKLQDKHERLMKESDYVLRAHIQRQAENNAKMKETMDEIRDMLSE